MCRIVNEKVSITSLDRLGSHNMESSVSEKNHDGFRWSADGKYLNFFPSIDFDDDFDEELRENDERHFRQDRPNWIVNEDSGKIL